MLSGKVAGGLVLLLVVTLLATGLPPAAPTVCTDGCEDESGGGCFDCACWAPTRAPAVLGAPSAPVPVTASPREAESTPRTAHVAPSEIFHVPRFAV